MKTCFFIGHRDAPATLHPALQQAIQSLCQQHKAIEFVVGHYGAFDAMAAKAVVKAKKAFPQARLTMLLPYHPEEQRITLPAGFDGSIYPPDMERVPKRVAIVRANRYMVDHADYLICYAWQPGSNATQLLEYALQKELTIIRLSDNR